MRNVFFFNHHSTYPMKPHVTVYAELHITAESQKMTILFILKIKIFAFIFSSVFFYYFSLVNKNRLEKLYKKS